MMTLGQAVEWMMRHPQEELVDQDGDFWYYDGEDKFWLRTSDPDDVAELANIHVQFMLDYLFHEPPKETDKCDT